MHQSKTVKIDNQPRTILYNDDIKHHVAIVDQVSLIATLNSNQLHTIKGNVVGANLTDDKYGFLDDIKNQLDRITGQDISLLAIVLALIPEYSLGDETSIVKTTSEFGILDSKFE